MHSGKRISLGQNAGLLGRQLFESSGNHSLVGIMRGEANIGGVVPGLGFEQTRIELGQFGVARADVICEHLEPLARSGFDQPGNEELIDCPMRLVSSDQFAELPAIGTWLLTSESDTASLEPIENQKKVLQFFAHDLGHLTAQLFIFGISEDQVHRHSRCLLFAMGMVDEDLFEAFVDLPQPASVSL